METASFGDQDPKPLKSNPTFQTDFPAIALQSSVSGCLRPHPRCLLCQATSVGQAPNWQPPLLPLGSSSGSEGMLYYFSPHCTTIAHLSVGILYHQTLVGCESSHSTSHW